MGDNMTLEEIKAEMKLKRKKKLHPDDHKRKKFLGIYMNKIFITIIITLLLLITLKRSEKFEKLFYENVFETYFNFSKINQTYEKYFGSSIPFSGIINNETKSVFSETLTYKSKEKYEDGVKLTVENEYLVPILESGMVVFIGDKDNYGKTVIIQQIDGKDVWYSSLENINVNLYDYVEKGNLLGEVEDCYLTLVFKKDGKVLDYEEELS
jgi:stage IV sporulation protein FA